MQEFSSILKFLATSNAINFLIMLVILGYIIKKVNLGKTFQQSVDAIEKSIETSNDEKLKAQEVFKVSKEKFDNLPCDIDELRKNSADKVEIFKSKISENAQKSIKNLEDNVEKMIVLEEKKISSLITEDTSKASVQRAKEKIIEMLREDPKLHDEFIQNSLEELDKVVL